LQNKPRLDQANLGLLFNESKLLLNDNLGLILECEKIKEILFYSLDSLNLLDINKKIQRSDNVNIEQLSLQDFDEDEIRLLKKYDLIVSFLALHYSNDVIGSLIQYKNCLKHNGSFLAILFGGETLMELKSCFIEADENLYGKVYPRIIPMIRPEIVPSLLQRAKYNNPIMTIEKVKIYYDSLKTMVGDLKNLGQRNFLKDKSNHLDCKNYFKQIESLYFKKYSDKDKIYASFEFIIIFSSRNQNIKIG
jgi:SAM-dependent methyltransferase